MSKRSSKTAASKQENSMVETSDVSKVNASQITRNVSVRDKHQQNTRSWPPGFPANNKPSSNKGICISSTYSQCNSFKASTSSSQHISSSKDDSFNIQNLPNIQLKTKDLFCL